MVLADLNRGSIKEVAEYLNPATSLRDAHNKVDGFP
jgi:hypothetical protein